MPERIQRSRQRKNPPNTICVTRPSRKAKYWPCWGNPFIVGLDGDAAECVRKFEALYQDDPVYQAKLTRELAGKNLACTCPIGGPCHAEVQLRWANS